MPGFLTHLGEGAAHGVAVAFAASYTPDGLDFHYKIEDAVPQLVVDKTLVLDSMALIAPDADAEDP